MSLTIKNNVGMIGYGRFGKVLADMLRPHFPVTIYDKNQSLDSLDTVLAADTLFIAVPIRHFEETINSIAPRLQRGTTLIDVCSVKLHPVSVMKNYLSNEIDIIATHPLFGPDSIHERKNLKIVMHSVRDTYSRYPFWKNFFSQQHLSIIEMSPEEHDRYAAVSQSITHFIGRCLQETNAQSTPIDTIGFKQLLSVMEQTCHDSIELFGDLLHYNPYSSKAIDALLRAALQCQPTH